jgi:hypothetical protein
MYINDDIVELFANSKIEDAYLAFEKKHGYDPRGHANDQLKYYTYEIEQESEEEDELGFEEPKEPIYVIELHYGEVTRHDCPYSITTSYFLDDFKKEIRDIQIEKIL